MGGAAGGGGGMTMAGGIGMAADFASGLADSFIKKPKAFDLGQDHGIATNAAEVYNKQLEKTQKAQGILGSVGKMGMQSGNPIGMAIGGAAMIASKINWGAGKQQAAMGDYKNMVQAGDQMNMANQGAINYNSNNAGYKAVAYGKKGMKFKTKF